MSDDLAVSHQVHSTVTDEELRAALLQAASSVGKAYKSKDGAIVVRPAGAIHRVVMRGDVQENRSGGKVASVQGRIDIGPGLLILSVAFIALAIVSIIGIVIAFLMFRWSRKMTANAFNKIVSNTNAMLS